MLFVAALALATGFMPSRAHARALDVDVWTDRGTDAVYDPGDRIVVKSRATDDAYLLVYEIDSEGYVRVLWPLRGRSGRVEARRTYQVPPADADYDLVIQESTGQSYIVAIASREPFERLPWYLRPYDPQAAEVGFAGQPDDEDGVTAEGRIVGDPFVAMERIRRQVLSDPDDEDAFATQYTTYYVHERVRYPRYMCYDCHRPGYWSWWDGFDPYYATCSAFDFRVNYNWYWGPTYWFGAVPYYCYVPRAPRYRVSAAWYSSWDGWRVWTGLWGGALRRYKSAPPVGYVPPNRWTSDRWKQSPPPGILLSSASVPRGPSGIRTGLPMGGNGRPREDNRGGDRPWVTHDPALRSPRLGGPSDPMRGGRYQRPLPVEPSHGDQEPRIIRPREERMPVDRPRGDNGGGRWHDRGAAPQSRGGGGDR
ncbi:MAG TPA: DUF4384 domain-containing protein, partial [Candidatus Eisenbacteria bacterium]|nr:DUF4384 domain-containing protein [Candidatus Eisenbacteria bacterium]